MQPMTPEDIHAFVQHAWLGHMGLAKGGQAYVIPIFYGYADGAFYFQSLHGEKDEFLETTQEACLNIVSAASEDHWSSVMVFGPVARVDNVLEQKRAMDLLLRLPLPPALGLTATGEPRRGEGPVFYWKLTPKRMVGRKSEPPALAP